MKFKKNHYPMYSKLILIAGIFLGLSLFAEENKKMEGIPTKDEIKSGNKTIKIFPQGHASLVISTQGLTVYVDPVGSSELYKGLPGPDVILITHGHRDHMNLETIRSLAKKGTVIIGPKVAQEQIPHTMLMTNGLVKKIHGMRIEAVPMYNVTRERAAFHPKGEGNGYVLTLLGKRIYISGDTENTPEMKGLKNIDAAFICMNLPYTMTVEQAAKGVLAFKPRVVYPYHYRNSDKTLSDLALFKKLVSVNPGIEVRLLKWY